jgi:outer membrane lipoprotein SlyB
MSSESAIKPGIHPLVAGAAAAVIIASGVGVAAMTGKLPGSSAQQADPQAAAPAAAPAKTPPAQPTQAPAAAAAKPHPSKPVQVASAATSAAQAKPHCAACGVVVDVKEVVVKGEGSGVGVVAGGVAGGVLAHEIFDGRNQGLATIAGAAGGAVAGNAIEKNVKTKKHYEVAVRMNDGSSKTIAYAEAPAWKPGDKVKVAGAKLEAQ